MASLKDLKVEIQAKEEKLLSSLRKLSRDKRNLDDSSNKDACDDLTHGQRIADAVAAMMGSWKFIIIQSIILMLWIVFNITAYLNHWDPYPFILLNLALSFQAAYAAPFIMMSQNRQQDIDRKEAQKDYVINVKAELEIELLHQKIDQMRELEILHLTETVKELTDILSKAKLDFSDKNQ